LLTDDRVYSNMVKARQPQTCHCFASRSFGLESVGISNEFLFTTSILFYLFAWSGLQRFLRNDKLRFEFWVNMAKASQPQSCHSVGISSEFLFTARILFDYFACSGLWRFLRNDKLRFEFWVNIINITSNLSSRRRRDLERITFYY
jgi:hypothetical protein